MQRCFNFKEAFINQKRIFKNIMPCTYMVLLLLKVYETQAESQRGNRGSAKGRKVEREGGIIRDYYYWGWVERIKCTGKQVKVLVGSAVHGAMGCGQNALS